MKKHPLFDEHMMPFIQNIEAKYTVDEVISWIKINVEMLKDAGDPIEKNDAILAYKKELQSLLSQSQTLKRFSVKEALRLLNIKWRYE